MFFVEIKQAVECRNLGVIDKQFAVSVHIHPIDSKICITPFFVRFVPSEWGVCYKKFIALEGKWILK